MRSCQAVLVLLALISPAARAADAAAGKPYEYEVLLKFGANRLLTPTFCRQLADELRDGLQSAFGPLAHVKVIDVNSDATAKANWIDPSTPDWPDRLRPGKRHFVAIDFAHDEYSVRARQHDGATGQASPLVRQAKTADRRFVGRQVLRFLNEDFGAVGTLSRKEEAKVWLQLQGGAVPSIDLARWVPPGSVFALVEVRGDGTSAQVVPATYVRSTAPPTNGQVECELFSRYENPIRFWPQVTYRAIRLGTTASRLRLRVTNPHGLPQRPMEVRVSAPDSLSKDAVLDRGNLRDSQFETRTTYQGLAVVRIGSGTMVTVPVPILDDRPVEISVKALPEEEAKDTVLADVRRETRALHDIILRLTAQRKELARLLSDEKKNREALEQVQTWLERLDDEQKLHAKEVARLRTETRKVNADVGPALTECDQALVVLRGARDRLQDLERSLKSDRERTESPDVQEKRDAVAVLMQRVKLHKEAAEYEEAIETFRQIIAQTGEREDVRKLLTELEEAWKLKGPDHEEARRFSYSIWPKIATFEDLKAKLPEARQKFEVCKKHGDRLTTHKLHIEATGVATKILLDEGENIKKSEGDEAPLLLTQLQKVKQELETLIKDMQGFIDAGNASK
jgi:tetratricopeptide (TPR) repeat protein